LTEAHPAADYTQPMPPVDMVSCKCRCVAAGALGDIHFQALSPGTGEWNPASVGLQRLELVRGDDAPSSEKSLELSAAPAASKLGVVLSWVLCEILVR
jgi:hypothetical protein